MAGGIAPGPPTNSAHRFAHVDALRAVAVLLVVVAHAGLGNVVPGGTGVTIFFAISGFIITYSIIRERERTGGFSLRGFYARRAAKLAPPFLIAILVPTIVYSLFAVIDWRQVAGQIFFYFNWLFVIDTNSGVPIDILPGSVVVWSLSIEEQFYIAFAIVWILAVRRLHWKTIMVCTAGAAILIATAARMWLAIDPANEVTIYYGTITRLDGIAWGILAAVLYHSLSRSEQVMPTVRRVLGSNWVLLAAVALFIISLVVRDEYFRNVLRFTLQSLGTVLFFLYGFLAGPSRVRSVIFAVVSIRLVQVIGLASYSIYLVHHPVIQLMQWLVPALDSRWAVPLLVVIGVLPAIAVYYLVEKPVARFMHRNRAPSRAPVGDLRHR